MLWPWRRHASGSDWTAVAQFKSPRAEPPMLTAPQREDDWRLEAAAGAPGHLQPRENYQEKKPVSGEFLLPVSQFGVFKG